MSALRNIFKSTEPTDVEAATRRRDLAQAMQVRALQGTQIAPQYYTPGTALADLGSSLVSAYSAKKANAAYDRAKDAQSQKTADALKRYQGSVPDDQVASTLMDRLKASAPDELPDAVDSRSQATQGLMEVMPEDSRQQMVQALVAQQMGAQDTQTKGLYGAVQPDKFTPESLAAFEKSKKYSDLRLRNIGQQYGRYNPGDFTPESWSVFVNSGDPSGLERYIAPQNASVEQVAGGIEVVQPDKRGGAPRRTVISTPQQEMDAAARLAGQKAELTAVGEGSGKVTAEIIKKGSNAATVTDLLDIAEPLIEASTGSALGAGADTLAAFFGKSPDGATAISKLKVVAGQLVAQMPRMEGPQSDADRMLYQQAAGDLANPTIPREQRAAAAQTIRQLQEKYKKRAAGVTKPQAAAPTTAPAANVINFADLPN